MNTVLKAVLVRSFAGLEQLGESWDRLAGAQPVPEIFHTFAWARAWWDAYGHDYEIYSPVVHDSSGEIVAIWPLVRHKAELRAIGHGASDNTDLLVTPQMAPSALRSALELLSANGREWNTGYVTNVSGRGLLIHAARNVDGPLRKRMEIVNGGRGFTALGDSALFMKLAAKESLRRHRKKLERKGVVTFRHIEDSEEVRRHLATLERQHIQRWALKGLRSSFLNRETQWHHQALPDYLPPAGSLRVGVLEVDGLPVAYHLGFEFAGKLVWYKPTFDVDFWDSGPGEVLLQSVLHYCASAGIHELDFTLGDEAYKSRFSSLTYDFFQIHLFSRWSASQYLLQARERLKRNHALYIRLKSLWVRGLDWLHRLRHAVERDGLVGFARKRLQPLARISPFRRDEVIVFRVSREQSIPRQLPVPDLEIVPLRTSLLAEAWLRHPDDLDPARIARLRQRIAAGDRGVVALHQGHVAHIAWIGKREAIVAGTETGPNCVIRLPQEVSVIYDCWTPQEFRGRGIYPAVLRWLVQEELRTGREIWIYCTATNLASRAGILKAGFTEVARMLRVLWFGRRERCRVTVVDKFREQLETWGAGR